MKKKSHRQNNVDLISYINNIIINSRKTECMKFRLRNLLYRLREFSNERRTRLYSDSFSYSMFEEFVYFLKRCHLLKGDKTKFYRHNNVCSFIRSLKSVLNSLRLDGYDVNMSYKEFKINEEEVRAVYLTQEELSKLASLNLRSKEATATRDRFLVGCYIAQRFSDYSRITVEQNFDLKANEIRLKTVKTGATVVVPIHPEIREILKRNNYILPKLNSLAAFNTCIKRLCKRAGIAEQLLLEYTEGTTVVRKKVPKYKLVSSHTARRTGITLMYLSGMQLWEIMLISGHKTEEACLKYMCISREENAKKLTSSSVFSREIAGAIITRLQYQRCN